MAFDVKQRRSGGVAFTATVARVAIAVYYCVADSVEQYYAVGVGDSVHDWLGA